jgi:hypothetical protein
LLKKEGARPSSLAASGRKVRVRVRAVAKLALRDHGSHVPAHREIAGHGGWVDADRFDGVEQMFGAAPELACPEPKRVVLGKFDAAAVHGLCQGVIVCHGALFSAD